MSNEQFVIISLLDRNVQLAECITHLPEVQADDLSELPHWRKRLETIPKRLAEVLNGEILEFDKDTRRWRRRIRYYKEVCSWHFLFHNPLQQMHHDGLFQPIEVATCFMITSLLFH